MRILCVGGALDGRFMDLDEAHLMPRYEFREPAPIVPPSVNDENYKATFKTHAYRIHEFAGGREFYQKRYFLAPDRVEWDDALSVMDALIRGYKPQ